MERVEIEQAHVNSNYAIPRFYLVNQRQTVQANPMIYTKHETDPWMRTILGVNKWKKIKEKKMHGSHQGNLTKNSHFSP